MKHIKLGNLDVTVVVDRSGSMDTKDTKSGQSRWDYAAETIQSFVKKLGEHDDDGIDLVFFNRQFSKAERVTPASFETVWGQHEPAGGTAMAEPLQWALNLSLNRRGEKNQLIVVLTDGQPDDENAVARVIIDASKRMERDEQLAILFLQVGTDKKATDFLARLDKSLDGAKFDIVHTKPLDAVADMPLQDVVNDAFND